MSGLNDVILLIDTAVEMCHVGLATQGSVIASAQSDGKNSHSAVLHRLVDEVLYEARLGYEHLAAVAVSAGPGSYTGLRIGLSVAKGFCYALDIPLIGIPTLDYMAFALRQYANVSVNDVLFMPMIDARRNEVFVAIFDKNLQKIKEPFALLLDEHTFDNIPDSTFVITGGNGSMKLHQYTQLRENFLIVDENIHHCKHMASLAFDRFQNGIFDNLAYFVPFYLKDYIPGKPHVKGLQ